ncbi:MAG: hypothetical protein CMI55_00485 [Parcubacteria group bacterium]|jgi:glycosyltransferase involved in cell wall biosynthesis|nr:hypothetical protein [Parcubacteria group bacterium]|tara:strand:+ start:8127 stop:9362 length:1236 start_codon:yes stop_codon:yes gene_type:complete
MKVLQINKFFFIKGGAERYFFDLAELLTKKAHQVSVWSAQHPQNFHLPEEKDFAKLIDFSDQPGFSKVFKKARRIFWNKEAKKKLEKIVKYKKPDIAHLHNIFSHFSPSIIFALKKYNIPIAMTLHDYKLFCPNYKFFSQKQACFDCLKEKDYRFCLTKKCIKDSYIESLGGYLEGIWQRDFLKVAEQIDVFLAPSLFLKRKALAWGIPKEKIVYLPYFVNKSSLSLTPSNKDSYLLYFGRLSREKGVDLLIRSFLEISDQFPQVKLKIAGDGPEKENLEKLAGYHQQIEFLGIKKGKLLQKTIANACSIIVPSLWPENFPYAVLESLALAKPVMAAKIGGLSEMIKNMKTGLLFKPNNQNDLSAKMAWALKHLKLINQMGRQGQAQVLSKYNPENHYKKIIKIYERVKHH